MRVRLVVIASLLASIRCDKSPSPALFEAFTAAFAQHKSSSVRIIGRCEHFEHIDFASLPAPHALWCTKIFATNATDENNSISSALFNGVVFAGNQEIFSTFANLRLFRLDGFFTLLSLQECSASENEEVFAHLWKRQIFNVNLICERNSEVLMTTFLPYQHGSCGNTSVFVINKFANHAWGEKETVVFPAKFGNLHGCQLRVASFFYPPITMREALRDGSFRYYGSEMEILKLLADSLNFSVAHNFLTTSGASGILLENGTATGILKQTIDGEMDMLMAFYYLTYVRTQFLSFSQSHYSVPLVIMIPLGKPFTAFEKLFNPLQFTVWIFLLATILIGMLCIAIVNCQNEKIRSFIYGTGVRAPYMNFLSVLLNGSQTKLPRRTFARYLLMMFMIFCLVLRTLYQGSLFQFLQADDRSPELSTIDEMMERNFVFYIRETLEHNIKKMSFFNRRRVVKFADYPELRKKTLDPSFNGGIIMPLLEVILENQQNYKNFTYKVLKEYLFDVQIVFYYPKNFHLVHAINDKIAILKAAGLISMLMDKYVDKTYINIKTGNPGPRRINIEQLFGGFEILFFGIVTSVLVFFGEVMSVRCDALRKMRKCFTRREKRKTMPFLH